MEHQVKEPSPGLDPINIPSSSSIPTFSTPNNYSNTDDNINVDAEREDEKQEVDGDEYFSSFPPGYRFKPHDEELIVCYLIKKIYNQELPRNQIKDVELYKYNPDILAAKYKPIGDDEWYFFTPRDRKYPNGQRPDRSSGDGYWKATGADKPITFRGSTVGSRTALVFYRGKQPSGVKTKWIMHEYKLSDAPKRKKISQNDMKLDNWVLCKLRKKRHQTDKTTKSVDLSPVEDVSPVEVVSPVEDVSPVEVVSPVEYVSPVEVVSPVEDVSSGGNHSCEYSDVVNADNNGISESIEPPFDQGHASSAYAQQTIVDDPDSVPSSSPIPFDNTDLQTSYYHLIYDPPLEGLDCIFPPEDMEY